MSEQIWIPEVGRIVVRHVLGVHVNQVSFRLRTEANEPRYYRELAVLSSFVGMPSGVVQIDDGPQHEYQRDAPQLVVRRIAGNNDIHALYRLWHGRPDEDLYSWVARVIREEVGLHQDERRRLQSLLTTFDH